MLSERDQSIVEEHLKTGVFNDGLKRQKTQDTNINESFVEEAHSMDRKHLGSEVFNRMLENEDKGFPNRPAAETAMEKASKISQY